MMITSVIRNLAASVPQKRVENLSLEWYETSKRVQRVQTDEGTALALRFTGESMQLREGDVLYEDEEKLIVVRVRPCQAICMRPSSLLEYAAVCFELGNKHLSVFFQEGEILLPYEESIFGWLDQLGYRPLVRAEKLWCQANPDLGMYYRQKTYSKKHLTIRLQHFSEIKGTGE